MRISDWSSDVCSSDLQARAALPDAWAAVKCGVPREVIEIINAALAKAMPVKPRVWKRLDSYSALMVDYHNAIAAVFWNLGPECCWIVFNEPRPAGTRSEEHTSELQSLMRISYAVFCLKTKKKTNHNNQPT